MSTEGDAVVTPEGEARSEQPVAETIAETPVLTEASLNYTKEEAEGETSSTLEETVATLDGENVVQVVDEGNEVDEEVSLVDGEIPLAEGESPPAEGEERPPSARPLTPVPEVDVHLVPIEIDLEEKYPPDGFIGLDMMDGTQARWGMKWGTQVGENYEYKFIPKEGALAEVERMGAGSDFNSRAKKIAAYKGDLLLVIKSPAKLGEDNECNYIWAEKEKTYKKYCEKIEEAVAKAKADVLAKWEEAHRPKEIASSEAGADIGAEDDVVENDEGPILDYEEKILLPRPWPETGVSEEVTRLAIVNNRPLVGYHIAQERGKFGKKCQFNDYQEQKPSEFTVHKNPDVFMDRIEMEHGFQAASEHREASTQTVWWRAKLNKALQYTAAVWPKEQCDKLLSSAELIEFIKSAESRVTEVLKSNETVDLFQDEFEQFADEEMFLGNRSENNLKELHSFTDLTYSKNKNISAIDWHPTKYGLVSFACSNNFTYDQWVELAGKVLSSCILIWNFADLLHPEMVLDAPGNLLCFKLNPNNPNLVVGGLSTGQAIFWDLTTTEEKRAASGEDQDGTSPPVKPTILSMLDRSHTRGIKDIVWLPPGKEFNKKGEIVHCEGQEVANQFATLGGDGSLLIWDIRIDYWKNPQQLAKEEAEVSKKKWFPVVTVSLHRPGSNTIVSGVSILLQSGSSAVVGTEEGDLAILDIVGKVDGDNAKPQYVSNLLRGHYQAVCSIQRSPHFPEIYFTVGDWSFSLWKVGKTDPVFRSPCADSYLVAGRWSPTRPGIIVTGRADGSIDVWDLLDQGHKASINFSTGSDAITSMEFWESKGELSKQHLAVGDAAGKLHVIDIPRNLRRKLPNEETLMKKFYERELARVEYTNKRQEVRAAELKILRAAQGGHEGPGGDDENKYEETAESKQKARDAVAKAESDQRTSVEKGYQALLEDYKIKLNVKM